MVEEAFSSADRPLRCIVEGDAGNLPAQVATPLAVVLNELLQNAFDHAYPEGVATDGAEVVLDLRRKDTELFVQVADDGVGLPPGFTLTSSTGLGLSIVRTLVTTELGGSIELRTGDGAAPRPGTVVDLHVPIPEHVGP